MCACVCVCVKDIYIYMGVCDVYVCIHTEIHTPIDTYMYAYLRTSLSLSVCTYMLCIYAYTRSCVRMRTSRSWSCMLWWKSVGVFSKDFCNVCTIIPAPRWGLKLATNVGT